MFENYKYAAYNVNRTWIETQLFQFLYSSASGEERVWMRIWHLYGLYSQLLLGSYHIHWTEACSWLCLQHRGPRFNDLSVQKRLQTWWIMFRNVASLIPHKSPDWQWKVPNVRCQKPQCDQRLERWSVGHFVCHNNWILGSSSKMICFLCSNL